MQFAHESFCRAPVDTPVGDGYAVAQLVFWLREGLAASEEIALDHCSHDGGISLRDLAEEFAHDLGLSVGLLRGIIMTAIDQDGLGQIRFLQKLFRLGDVDGAIVRSTRTSAQHQVAVWVPARNDRRGGSI